MRLLVLFFALLFALVHSSAQDRMVKLDFEAAAFLNNPKVPFDQPFVIEGEVDQAVAFVAVNIYYENTQRPAHRFTWNRDDRNQSSTFSIQIPGVLRSNTKYDFEVITYTRMTTAQKTDLKNNLRQRIAFFIYNNYRYDGKNIGITNPTKVFNGLAQLIEDALALVESKNNIPCEAPSPLVLDELKKQRNYRFNTLFKRSKKQDRDEVANTFVDKQVNLITDLALSEVMPYINADLVQHHRRVKVLAVSTDREPFTLPINAGMYAWNKSTSIGNVTVRNTNFTPGIGFTIPFSGRSTLASKSRLLDSFGYSMGVLIEPIRDASGQEFITPRLNIPAYAGVGFRLFKVIRMNAGALIVGERGLQDFNQLTILPTLGLAVELNVWAGIKK